MNKLLITLLLAGLVIGIFALPKPDQAEDQVAGADSAKAGPKTEAMKEAENSADQSTTDSDKDGDHDDDDDNDDHTDNKVADTDSDIILFPFFGPIYQRLQESLQQVQNQLDSMWNMSLNSTGMMEIPDDYHNSTSSTKIINGTVVTVNETVKKVNEDGIRSVFHIRVISLRPESSDDDDDSHQMSQQKASQDQTTPETTTVTVAPDTDA